MIFFLSDGVSECDVLVDRLREAEGTSLVHVVHAVRQDHSLARELLKHVKVSDPVLLHGRKSEEPSN